MRLPTPRLVHPWLRAALALVLAGTFGFDKRPLFTVSEPSDRNAPQVDFGSSTTTTGG